MPRYRLTMAKGTATRSCTIGARNGVEASIIGSLVYSTWARMQEAMPFHDAIVHPLSLVETRLEDKTEPELHEVIVWCLTYDDEESA